MIPSNHEFLEQQHSLEMEAARRKKASILLRSLGLTWETLKHTKSVLDVGAKDCSLQISAREQNISGIISLDKKFPTDVKEQGLNLIEADAINANLEPSSQDLILVRSSAYYYSLSVEETMAIFQKLHAALKRGGRQLIFPARFGHIIEDLKSKNPQYRRVKEKDYDQLGTTDKIALDFYNNLADKLSVDFLKEKNIFARRLEVISPNAPESFKYYLEIPKL